MCAQFFYSLFFTSYYYIKQFLNPFFLPVDMQVAEQTLKSRRAVIIRDRTVLWCTFWGGVSAALIYRLLFFGEHWQKLEPDFHT